MLADAVVSRNQYQVVPHQMQETSVKTMSGYRDISVLALVKAKR